MANYIRANTLKLAPNTFRENVNITSVDLQSVEFVGNSMSNAFLNCINLTHVTNINQNISTMFWTFTGCKSLVEPPVIPNSIQYLVSTFSSCTNLVNAPVIPNSVHDISHAFSGCTNLINAPIIPNSVTNIYGTFSDCTNLTGNITIPNSVVDKIDFTFNNCKSLINAPIISSNANINSMWRTFYKCVNLTEAPIIPENVSHMTYTFYDCHSLTDAPTIPNSVELMSYAFGFCYNLVNIPSTIPNSVVGMAGTFMYCTNITQAPIISNSVVNMVNTFYHCVNITETPIIPDSVNDMSYTFGDCYNLINASNISNSTTNMAGTFINCTNLVNIPAIPNSVINMYGTFYNCSSLTGNIYIHSNQINSALNCFNRTSLQKNVYIPYYNLYTNKALTDTYNSFTTAGYDENGIQNDVYLKNLTPSLTINPTPNDADVQFECNGNVLNDKTISVAIGDVVNYAVSKTDYHTVTNSITINQDETLNITLESTGCEITINPTPADATVTFNTPGTVSGNTITVLDGTTVLYTVSRTGYQTVNDSCVAQGDQITVNVSLTKNNYTLTINPTPSDATVTFSTGTVSGNTTTVPYETTVTYDVTKANYISEHGSTQVTTNTTIPVTLTPDTVTLTIDPTPADATVILTAQGYSQSGNSITVPTGTNVTYTVSRTDYDSTSGNISVNNTNTYPVTIYPTKVLYRHTETNVIYVAKDYQNNLTFYKLQDGSYIQLDSSKYNNPIPYVFTGEYRSEYEKRSHYYVDGLVFYKNSSYYSNYTHGTVINATPDGTIHTGHYLKRLPNNHIESFSISSGSNNSEYYSYDSLNAMTGPWLRVKTSESLTSACSPSVVFYDENNDGYRGVVATYTSGDSYGMFYRVPTPVYSSSYTYKAYKDDNNNIFYITQNLEDIIYTVKEITLYNSNGTSLGSYYECTGGNFSRGTSTSIYGLFILSDMIHIYFVGAYSVTYSLTRDPTHDTNTISS